MLHYTGGGSYTPNSRERERERESEGGGEREREREGKHSSKKSSQAYMIENVHLLFVLHVNLYFVVLWGFCCRFTFN